MRKSAKPTREDLSHASSAIKLLPYKWNKLFLEKDGTLRQRSGPHTQIVLPKSLRPLVYKEQHGDMGHLRVDIVVSLARERFYWPHMQQDIANFIYRRCQCLKPHHTPREPLQPIITSAQFEVISIDYLHLERSSSGYEYILVVVDHFTRYAQAYMTRNKSGKTAVNLLYNDFILRFGLPSKIRHDQVASMKINSSIVSRNYPMSSTHEQHPTTRKVAGKPKDSTEPFHQCFTPYRKPTSLIGETICPS